MLFFWKLHPIQEKTCCKCSQWWRIPRPRSVSHTHHSEQGRSASFEQLLGSSHRRPLNKYRNIKSAQVSSDPKTLIDEWSSSSQVANFLTFMGIWQFHHTLLSKNHGHPWHSCRDQEWSLPPWAENIGGDDDINHLCHGKRVTQERTTGWTCPFLCQSRAFHDTIHNITESGKPTMSKMWTK